MVNYLLRFGVTEMCIFVFGINKWFSFCCTFLRCLKIGHLFISLFFNKTKYICRFFVCVWTYTAVLGLFGYSEIYFRLIITLYNLVHLMCKVIVGRLPTSTVYATILHPIIGYAGGGVYLIAESHTSSIKRIYSTI